LGAAITSASQQPRSHQFRHGLVNDLQPSTGECRRLIAHFESSGSQTAVDPRAVNQADIANMFLPHHA
jgi:hypothetical protein